MRRLLAWSASFCLATLGLVALNSPAATAADRVEVYCGEDEQSDCSTEQLLQRISEAGNVATRIILSRNQIGLTKTIAIPAGADIELVGHAPYQPGNNSDITIGGNTTVYREDGFTGPMISVAAGGSLTLSENQGGAITFSSRGEQVAGKQNRLLDIFGAVVMNAGTLRDARNVGGYAKGAVTVSGKDATFVLNGGKIIGNYRVPDTSDGQGGAGNVSVTYGASFTMNGGEISYGRDSKIAGNGIYYGYGEGGGVAITDGASFTMNGGSIHHNWGFAGGISAYHWLGESDYSLEKATARRVKVEINGGEIHDNYGYFGGGALQLFGNAVGVMNGGRMYANKAANGGAVSTMDMWVQGADFTWEEIPSDGMRSGLTHEQWNQLSPASFEMNGGEITGNHAYRTGGGVNIVSDRVVLNGGLIAKNSSHGMGGGIYVATASYNVHLADVLVAQNDASIGGGLWFCPTGRVDVYVRDGGAIFDNTASMLGADVGHHKYGSADIPGIWLSEPILGGGLVQWFDDNEGDQRYQDEDFATPVHVRDSEDPTKPLLVEQASRGWIGQVTPAHKKAAEGAAKLRIIGNEAPFGGGIGTNGGVTIGQKEPGVDIDLVKKWADSKDNSAPQGVTSVTLQLRRQAGDGPAEDYLLPFEIFEAQGWHRHFYDLPAQDENGVKYVYDIKEVSVPKGYVAKVERKEPDQDHTDFQFVITNAKPTTPPTKPEEPEENVPEEPEKPVVPEKPEVPKEEKPTPPPLVDTGSSAESLTLGAGALMAIGGLVVLARRRKS